MSNKPRRNAPSRSLPAKRPGAAPSRGPDKRTLVMWGAIAAVVIVVIAVVAILSTGGGDDEASSTTAATGPTTTVAGQIAASEQQPVTVVGTALADVPRDDTTDAAIGAAAPTLQGYTFAGTPIDIIAGDGTPELLVFLAHWCPHCNAEVPRLLEWKSAGNVPDGLDVTGVSTGVRSDAQNYPPSEWIVDKGWDWPVLADSDTNAASAAYGLTSYPLLVLVGADGSVLARHSGEFASADAINEWVRTGLGV